MKIDIRLDRVMVEKRISSKDLAEKIGLTPAMLSRIKNGKIKAIKLSTLKALCEVLDCDPGDILVAIRDED